jgi:plasmid stability protein
MTRQLTVRGVPDEVAERLEALSRAQRRSVNATVNEILEEAVGVDARARDLRRFITWTQDEVDQVNEEVAAQRRVDESDWR